MLRQRPPPRAQPCSSRLVRVEGAQARQWYVGAPPPLPCLLDPDSRNTKGRSRPQRRGLKLPGLVWVTDLLLLPSPASSQAVSPPSSPFPLLFSCPKTSWKQDTNTLTPAGDKHCQGLIDLRYTDLRLAFNAPPSNLSLRPASTIPARPWPALCPSSPALSRQILQQKPPAPASGSFSPAR